MASSRSPANAAADRCNANARSSDLGSAARGYGQFLIGTNEIAIPPLREAFINDMPPPALGEILDGVDLIPKRRTWNGEGKDFDLAGADCKYEVRIGHYIEGLQQTSNKIILLRWGHDGSERMQEVVEKIFDGLIRQLGVTEEILPPVERQALRLKYINRRIRVEEADYQQAFENLMREGDRVGALLTDDVLADLRTKGGLPPDLVAQWQRFRAGTENFVSMPQLQQPHYEQLIAKIEEYQKYFDIDEWLNQHQIDLADMDEGEEKDRLVSSLFSGDGLGETGLAIVRNAAKVQRLKDTLTMMDNCLTQGGGSGSGSPCNLDDLFEKSRQYGGPEFDIVVKDLANRYKNNDRMLDIVDRLNRDERERDGSLTLADTPTPSLDEARELLPGYIRTLRHTLFPSEDKVRGMITPAVKAVMELFGRPGTIDHDARLIVDRREREELSDWLDHSRQGIVTGDCGAAGCEKLSAMVATLAVHSSKGRFRGRRKVNYDPEVEALLDQFHKTAEEAIKGREGSFERGEMEFSIQEAKNEAFRRNLEIISWGAMLIPIPGMRPLGAFLVGTTKVIVRGARLATGRALLRAGEIVGRGKSLTPGWVKTAEVLEVNDGRLWVIEQRLQSGILTHAEARTLRLERRELQLENESIVGTLPALEVEKARLYRLTSEWEATSSRVTIAEGRIAEIDVQLEGRLSTADREALRFEKFKLVERELPQLRRTLDEVNLAKIRTQELTTLQPLVDNGSLEIVRTLDAKALNAQMTAREFGQAPWHEQATTLLVKVKKPIKLCRGMKADNLAMAMEKAAHGGWWVPCAKSRYFSRSGLQNKLATPDSNLPDYFVQMEFAPGVQFRYGGTGAIRTREAGKVTNYGGLNSAGGGHGGNAQFQTLERLGPNQATVVRASPVMHTEETILRDLQIEFRRALDAGDSVMADNVRRKLLGERMRMESVGPLDRRLRHDFNLLGDYFVEQHAIEFGAVAVTRGEVKAVAVTAGIIGVRAPAVAAAVDNAQ